MTFFVILRKNCLLLNTIHLIMNYSLLVGEKECFFYIFNANSRLKLLLSSPNTPFK